MIGNVILTMQFLLSDDRHSFPIVLTEGSILTTKSALDYLYMSFWSAYNEWKVQTIRKQEVLRCRNTVELDIIKLQI